MEKISVIIPIYNVEKYLERCLNSVIEQTYKNLEIILVDDGSPDGCAQICDIYKKKDERILVIHQKNKGLSGARNAGLDIATGKFVCFIDSDDYIDKNMIEILYKNLKHTNSDISICGFEQIDEDEKINKKEKQNNNIKILNKREGLKELIYHKYGLDIVTWNKLYKISLFDKIKFPQGKIYEDFATIPFLIDQSSNICVTDEKLYYYVQRKGSINNNLKFNSHIFDLIENTSKMENFIEEKYGEIYKYVIPGILFFNIIAINQLIEFNKDNENSDYITLIVEKIKKYKKSIIFSDGLFLMQKVKLLLLCHFNLYKKILIFYKRRIR